MTRHVRFATVALVAVLAAGCATVDDQAGDQAADFACTHFRNVAADHSDGLLTDDELRVKLDQVRTEAQRSSVEGLARHARGMVAALTQADRAGFDRHVTAFGDACRTVGL